MTAPAFTLQPVNVTKTVTDNATFSVAATGSPTPTFQWYFDGSRMVDKAEISGSATSTLSFRPAFQTDAGSYYAVASNGTDTTSTTAVLTLVPSSYGNGQGTRTASVNQVVLSDGTYLAGQLFDYN
jgi:large repetitive protein